MSPRAAWRLDRLGFASVHDYAAGKMDWLSYGLPFEGDAELAVSVLVTDVATCGLTATVAEARQALAASAHDRLVVLEDGVVAGALRSARLESAESDDRIDTLADLAPSTVRPSEDLEELRSRMKKKGAKDVIVSTPDGRFLGLVLP